MSILTKFSSIIAFSFALLIAMFIFWRQQKEDFDSNTIFSFAFYLIIGAFAGALFINQIIKLAPQSSLVNPSGVWFWGVVLGLISAKALANFKFKLRGNEVINALAPGLILIYLAHLLPQLLFSPSLPLIILLIIQIFLISLYYLSEQYYQKLSWYRSGRVGFSGYFVLGLFFLSRSTVALSFSNMLSLAGKIDIVLSMASAFLAFFLLYNLSIPD